MLCLVRIILLCVIFMITSQCLPLLSSKVFAAVSLVAGGALQNGSKTSSTPSPSPTGATGSPVHSSILPDIGLILSEKYSFLNHVKAIELIQHPEGGSKYILKAGLFSDGSIFIAGNTQGVLMVQMPLLVTGGPGNFSVLDMNNRPISDISFRIKENIPTLETASPSELFLSDLLQKNFTVFHSKCRAFTFDKSPSSSSSIYSLQSTCEMQFGYSHISLLQIKASYNQAFDMLDISGQSISNISNLNGVLQFEYGVNGVALSILQTQAMGALAAVTVDMNTQQSIGSMLQHKLAMFSQNLGPLASNPLTNTPNFYHIASRKFDVFKSCNAAGLDYIAGEGGYRLSANCIDGNGGYKQVSLNITLSGQNGRYQIADSQGRQISNIIYTNTQEIAGVFTQTPDLFTLIGRRFSIFNPKMCLRESITLTPDSLKKNQYELKATCASAKGVNITSALSLMIEGQDGKFLITDSNGVIVSDIYNDDGHIKIAPLAQIFHLLKAHDFMQSCKEPVMTLKDKETQIYTLSAMCNGPNASFKSSSLELKVTENNGVFSFIKNDNTSPCSSITVLNGELSCKPLA